MGYLPIEDYGVIGNLHTVALVGKNGSIDFLCFPRFDSPSVFAALLDDEKGGRFRIAVTECESTSRQMYFPDTNVLLTRFFCSEGMAEVLDFMPIEDHEPDFLVREVRVVRGELELEMRCAPRFDYARAGHRAEPRDGRVLFLADDGAGTVLSLRHDVRVRIEDGDAVARFRLKAGEKAAFVLEGVVGGDGESPSIAPDFVARSFQGTEDFWRRWIDRSRYDGRWREIVHRSALTLKLLVSRPHGAIVAAPTFGLPESIGGIRNWDYRYSWIRDSAFTIDTFLRLGYVEEAETYLGWLEGRCSEREDDRVLRVLYSIEGDSDVPEVDLPHLEGYRGSAPVRLGNAACEQLQLDIFGEILESIHVFDQRAGPIGYALWCDLVRQLEWLARHAGRPDHGIWEIRGDPRPYAYSRMMSWVAFDRGIRLATDRGFPAPLETWREARDAAFEAVLGAWSDELDGFALAAGSAQPDAALLRLPLVHFLSPRDPKWVSTFEAIDRELSTDALVYRYRQEIDPLAGQEGTFSVCSFWRAECLARMGRLDEARLAFEKMLTYSNHLGLYAEQLGPCGQHLGNFPQALTHLALVGAACVLDEMLDTGPRTRAG